jgi:hypothetical protein
MMVELMLERICWLRTIRGGFFVPTITPTDLERATWHHFMHGYAQIIRLMSFGAAYLLG